MRVVPFIGQEVDFDKEIDELEEWLVKSPAWSAEKYHYLHLVAMITENEVIPDNVRDKACYILCKHSDASKAIGKFYGVDTVETMRRVLR